MLFNTSYKNDFSPELEIDVVVLELVEKMKLLGVILTSNIKWREKPTKDSGINSGKSAVVVWKNLP